jgi:hypothetical protein
MSWHVERILRSLVLASAAMGCLAWLTRSLSLAALPADHSDSPALAGIALMTGYFLGLVLPTFILGLVGRWLPLALLLSVPVLGIAGHLVRPFLP